MNLIDKILVEIESVEKLYQKALTQNQFQTAAKLLESQHQLREAIRGWNISEKYQEAKRGLIVAVFLVGLFFGTSLSAAQYYVAPSASGSGNGSITNPWPLQMAFTNHTPIAGDTVWLRGGTYIPPNTNVQTLGELAWTIDLKGASNNLLTLRAYTNEIPVVDRKGMFGSSCWLRFRDLEITDSNKGHNPTNSGAPVGPWAQYDGALLNSSNEWVNCYVHDVNNMWSGGTAGSSIRGCVIINVGKSGVEHVCYPANNDFSGNICGWHSCEVINANRERPATFTSNIIFGAGQTINARAFGDFNVGGVATNAPTEISYNSVYNYYAGRNIGEGSIGVDGGSFNINSNTIVSAFPLSFCCSVGAQGAITVIGNTLVSRCDFQGTVFSRKYSDGSWTIDKNKYFKSVNPHENNVNFQDTDAHYYTFAQWRVGEPAFDVSSTASNSFPVNSAMVYPNVDQAKRANIAIYNWQTNDNVTVSLSGVLNSGDTYTLYSAQNYAAGPIKTGTYDGNSLSVPMTNLFVGIIPYGTNDTSAGPGLIQPPLTSPEFGAFVVIGAQSNAPPQKIFHKTKYKPLG